VFSPAFSGCHRKIGRCVITTQYPLLEFAGDEVESGRAFAPASCLATYLLFVCGEQTLCPDTVIAIICLPVMHVEWIGIDNDLDGKTDCADKQDRSREPAC
jgi:hypothetical protein